MTAPSNANTSGLEVVAYLEVSNAGMGRRSCLHQRKETPTMLRRWSSEPLVTAASAQSRIAELDEQLAQAAMIIIGKTDRAVAAEARADRLAKALEDAAHEAHGRGYVQGFTDAVWDEAGEYDEKALTENLDPEKVRDGWYDDALHTYRDAQAKAIADLQGEDAA